MSNETPPMFAYLNAMNDHGASDLYITVGRPPTLRVEDRLVYLSDTSLRQDDIQEILNSILTSRQKRDYELHMELNTPYREPC